MRVVYLTWRKVPDNVGSMRQVNPVGMETCLKCNNFNKLIITMIGMGILYRPDPKKNQASLITIILRNAWLVGKLKMTRISPSYKSFYKIKSPLLLILIY